MDWRGGSDVFGGSTSGSTKGCARSMFPALGGKQRRDRVTDVRDLLRTTCFLALLIGAAGCGGPDWKRLSVYERLQHSDPAARLWAVVEVGRSKDAKAVGYLVDRLTDSEPEIRMFAFTSLEKITGQSLGYRCYDPPTIADHNIGFRCISQD